MFEDALGGSEWEMPEVSADAVKQTTFRFAPDRCLGEYLLLSSAFLGSISIRDLPAVSGAEGTPYTKGTRSCLLRDLFRGRRYAS